MHSSSNSRNSNLPNATGFGCRVVAGGSLWRSPLALAPRYYYSTAPMSTGTSTTDNSSNNGNLGAIDPKDQERESKEFYRQKYAARLESKLKRDGMESVEEYLKKQREQLQQTEDHASTSSATKPLTLNDIMKTELLDAQNSTQILELWTLHHKNTNNYVAGGLTSAQYREIFQRGSECPLFIAAVPRDSGYEMFFVEIRNKQIGFTTLLEYQLHKENAPVKLLINFFDELETSKDLVLFRGPLDSSTMPLDAAQCLFSFIMRAYSDEFYQHVVNFNKHPKKFQIEDVLNAMFKVQNTSNNIE